MSVLVQIAILVFLTGSVALIVYSVKCFRPTSKTKPRRHLLRDYDDYDPSWMDFDKWRDSR